MREVISSSACAAVMVSIGLHYVGLQLKKRLKVAIVNPILIAIAGTIALLCAADIDYSAYAAAATPISFLLTPATVCLAIPLYRQLPLLRRNWKAISAGIALGTVTSLVSIWLLAVIFRLDNIQYVTLLPKSITTAIGMGVSGELGGIQTITVAVIILTGIAGNMLAVPVCRILRITDPVARGVAIGTASHAIGTARAMEMGQVTGAVSGLAIAISGILTVVLAPLCAGFI